jgi:hypothetical protein
LDYEIAIAGRVSADGVYCWPAVITVEHVEIPTIAPSVRVEPVFQITHVAVPLIRHPIELDAAETTQDDPAD